MNASASLSHFVWLDCLTPDIDRAIDFFSRLTSWKVLDQTSPNVGRYPVIKSQGGSIAGILEIPKFLQTSGILPYWTGYVHTDLKMAEDAIPRLGGQMFTMPTKSAMGTSFVFTDAGGAVLAAYELSDSFTVPSSSRESEIVWQRLYSADHEKSIGFYKALFDWQSVEEQGAKNITDQSGDIVGDMGAKPSWVDVDTWVYFIGVSDVSKTAAAIKDDSGSIIERTQIQDRSAIVARDAQGGVIGFVEC